MGADDTRSATSQRAAPDGFASWSAFWSAQGMPWRTEPEIDADRQRYLTERRAVRPDVARGIYPFRAELGSIRLDRADVEWLLAAHESRGMRGPVDWADERQRGREGLDLRGADLRGCDLRLLPLARAIGGCLLDETPDATPEQIELAAVHLEGATFRGFERQTHLEGARLTGAHLEGASLYRAHLELAGLDSAHVQGADLARAHLEVASLAGSQLEGATLTIAHLEGVNLSGAHLEGTKQHAPADLRRAFFDSATALDGAVLGDPRFGAVRVAGAHWGDVDLSVVAWDCVAAVGDESIARQPVDAAGRPKTGAQRLAEYAAATQANRQLATALRSRGLSDEADRFAYRAQVLQRQVFWQRRQGLRWFGSWLLDFVAGYGYRPLRSALAYVLIILGFAALYLLNGRFATPHLRWDEALVLSISSFHGRGFFTSGITLKDTLARLAAGEAIIGLLIEITFIATFTQRFFAR